jgi:hypothetical protein
VSVLRQVGSWVVRWQTTLVLLAITVVFIGGLHVTGELREADARAERTAAIRLCESGNERTAVLRDFMAPMTADPDERQYAFITDPQLRAGALDQARRSRAELRDRVAKAFTLRDCAAELPPPPDGGGH